MPHRKPAPAVPTVAAYFLQHLGEELQPASEREPKAEHSPYHPSFHIDTGCGVECRAAIDAGAAMLSQIRTAFGPLVDGTREHPKGAQLRVACVEAVRNVVLCFVYG